MAKYTTDEEANRAWTSLISYSNRENSELPLRFYNDFGGVEVFKKAKLSLWFRHLRDAILQSDYLPEEQYLELFNAMEKITKQDVHSFSRHAVVISNPTVFQKLWAVDPNGTFSGIKSHVTGELVSHKGWGTIALALPQVHGERCGLRPDKPHVWCHTPLVFHGDKRYEVFKDLKADMLERFDSTILKTIHDEIMSLNASSREAYASTILVADEHWGLLAKDKRPILNALVTNPLIPEALAYDIIASHKTPAIREEIARQAHSPELLETIWNSTASKTIHESVARNTVSGRHLSNPECLVPYYARS